MKTDKDGKPGLRVETAASYTARDMIAKHTHTFAHVLQADRAANASTSAAYIDGLAAVTALTIVGRHGSREDVTEATVKCLREAIDRDLRHLGGLRVPTTKTPD